MWINILRLLIILAIGLVFLRWAEKVKNSENRRMR